MKYIRVKHVWKTWDLDVTENAMWKDNNMNKLFINWVRQMIYAKLLTKVVTLNDICDYLALPNMASGQFYGLVPGDHVNIQYTNDGTIRVECRNLDY